MKDLDFDELDRAVNSLAAQVPEPMAQVPVEPIIAQPTNPVTPPTLSSVAAPSLAGRRSVGRFMDVVHPSSDMRSSSTLIPAERVPTAPEVVNQAMPIPTPAPAYTAPVGKPVPGDWPDPIDFHESTNNATSKQEVIQDEEDDIDKISNDITKTLNKTADESLDSPFLSGTKVEKRPLGAFSNESPAPVAESKPADEVANKEADTSKESLGDKINPPLPAELQDDLLKIEADSTTHPGQPDAIDTPPAVDQPAVPTSISQQYTEKPSSGDQSTGAIYDTNSYHKNLVRPAKKKSGRLWILWISILLVAGAGAGVAVYFFVLPH